MSVISINTDSLVKGADRFKNMGKELADMVDLVLEKNIVQMEEGAKQRAPGDMGFLRQNISADTSKYLHKELTANAFYAAYMEFGTGVYAAQYVATLPVDWQAYAAQFKAKGQGSGTFFDFLVAIKEWVKRVGIGVSYNVSTRRKNRQSNADIENVAYAIAMSILRKGVRPHPFLYPAYREQLPKLETDLENALKAFGR